MVGYKKNSKGEESIDLGLTGHKLSTTTWKGSTWGSKLRYVGSAAVYYPAVATVWIVKAGWNGAKIAAPHIRDGLIWSVEKSWNGAKIAAPKIRDGLIWSAEKGWNGAKIAAPKIRDGLIWSAEKGWNGAKIAAPKIRDGLIWSAEKGWNGAKIAAPKIRDGLIWSAEKGWNGAKAAALNVHKGVTWGAQSSWSGLQQAGQAVSRHASDLCLQLQTLPQRIKGQFAGGYRTLHEEPAEIVIQDTKEQLIPLSAHRFTQVEVASAIQEAMAASSNQKGTAYNTELPCSVVALQGNQLENNQIISVLA